MNIQEWKAAQTETDTLKLVKLAIKKPEIRTPQADLQVARDAYDYETEIRDIVNARYGPLSQYAGLSIKQRFLLLRSNLKAAYTNAPDQDAKDQALYDSQDIKSLNDQAKEVEGGMSHENFLLEFESVPQPDVITLGQSAAEDNNWTEFINASDEGRYALMDS